MRVAQYWLDYDLPQWHSVMDVAVELLALIM